MKYNFNEHLDRRGTCSMKWDARDFIKRIGLTDRYDEDTIPLFVADMDFPAPEPVIEALHRTVDHKNFGYTIAPEEYYAAIINWFKRRKNWDIKKEEIIYCPGTVKAIGVSIRAYSDVGDGVIIQRPVYPPFTSLIEENERVVVNNPLINYGGYYKIDFGDFEEKAKVESTKLFILCNPHNPSGRIFPEDELKRLADICHENNVIIVADEIHGDLIRKGNTFYPMVKCTDKTDHIVTCTAINKTFNVAGLHGTNLIISNEKLRKKFKKALGHEMPSPFTIAALIAAYNEGEEWLEQVIDYIDGNIDFVANFLKEKMPRVRVVRPEGTYIIWMDFRGYGIPPEDIKERIYHKANVILESGIMFGEEGTGFERICVSSPRTMIEEAMKRIAAAFEDVN
jgi:cystathionine beta-lyase